MSFAEIAEVSFQNGPKWCRGFAPVAKFSILFGLFLTYFGTCSVYTVIVAKNFEQVRKKRAEFSKQWNSIIILF